MAAQDWSHIEKEYGKRIKKATQEGCIAVWKKYTPRVFREAGSIPNGVIAGLAGLQLLYRTGKLDFQKMSSEDARRATHYALNELNDFSDWFPELARVHPITVAEVLAEHLLAEWKIPESSNNHGSILNRFVYRDHAQAELIKPFLREHLRLGDPANHSVLSAVLRFLTRYDAIDVNEWAEIAKQRIPLYSADNRGLLIWLVVWVQADADGAIRYLEAHLGEPSEADPRTNLLVLVSAALGERAATYPSLNEPSYENPKNAKAFTRLVFRYVAPDKDIIRSEGGYSPLARDDAQRFRDGLLLTLANSPLSTADAPLEALVNDPLLVTRRDWILHLADERAERMADVIPWDQEEARRFREKHEAFPKTLDDLFHITIRRMEAIKYDVEAAEESLRGAIRTGDDESRLQGFLVTELRRRNHDRYTAPREPQIDGNERPDVQIHRPGIDGHVQIETKLADMSSRSLTSMLNDLEYQVVGQYLRARNATHAIYLIGFAACQARRSWKDPESGEPLTFEDVITRLQKRAAELEESGEGVKCLRVVGIDFRPHS